MTTMRTIKILLLLVLTTSQSALAYNLKIDTVVVTNDSCRTLQLIATIDNTDNEALWIWLDCNDYSRDIRIKYLEPGNTFTFVFYLDKVAKDDYLDCNKKISDIRIFSNQQINEACPGLGTLYGIKRISYPHNVIAFPMESEGLVTTVSSLLSQ